MEATPLWVGWREIFHLIGAKLCAPSRPFNLPTRSYECGSNFPALDQRSVASVAVCHFPLKRLSLLIAGKKAFLFAAEFLAIFQGQGIRISSDLVCRARCLSEFSIQAQVARPLGNSRAMAKCVSVSRHVLPCPFMGSDCPSSTRKFLVGTSPFWFFVHFLESQARINLNYLNAKFRVAFRATRRHIITGCCNVSFPAITALPFSVKLVSHEIPPLPFSTNPLKFLEKGRSDFLAPSQKT